MGTCLPYSVRRYPPATDSNSTEPVDSDKYHNRIEAAMLYEVVRAVFHYNCRLARPPTWGLVLELQEGPGKAWRVMVDHWTKGSYEG